jgi:hypothetical protein
LTRNEQLAAICLVSAACASAPSDGPPVTPPVSSAPAATVEPLTESGPTPTPSSTSPVVLGLGASATASASAALPAPDAAEPNCRESPDCQREGRCGFDRRWRVCAPSSDLDCRQSAACAREGRCFVQSVCAPTDPCHALDDSEGARCVRKRP